MQVPIGGILQVEFEISPDEEIRERWRKKSGISMDLGAFASIRPDESGEGAIKVHCRLKCPGACHHYLCGSISLRIRIWFG